MLSTDKLLNLQPFVENSIRCNMYGEKYGQREEHDENLCFKAREQSNDLVQTVLIS